MIYSRRRKAFSLLELMAVLTIMGLLATVILPRVLSGEDSGKMAACHTYQGDIEIQAELWITNTGAWPDADLSNIGGDLSYFPAGLPTCPVDQTSYTIDTSTGRVIGHNH
jgi:general secretion pathway protein G